MITLDIDRHHKCVEAINNGNIHTRGMGFTTSYLNLMQSEISSGNRNNNYVYIGYNTNTVKYGKQDFERMVIREWGMSEITHTADNKIRNSINQMFIFLSIHDFIRYDDLRGIAIDRIFLDIADPIDMLDTDTLGIFTDKVNRILSVRNGDLL